MHMHRGTMQCRPTPNSKPGLLNSLSCREDGKLRCRCKEGLLVR
jgi:hypothetical protein